MFDRKLGFVDFILFDADMFVLKTYIFKSIGVKSLMKVM